MDDLIRRIHARRLVSSVDILSTPMMMTTAMKSVIRLSLFRLSTFMIYFMFVCLLLQRRSICGVHISVAKHFTHMQKEISNKVKRKRARTERDDVYSNAI